VVEIAVVTKGEGAIGVHFVASNPREHAQRLAVELVDCLCSLTIRAHRRLTVRLVRTPLVVKGDEAIDLTLELFDRVDLGLAGEPLL